MSALLAARGFAGPISCSLSCFTFPEDFRAKERLFASIINVNTKGWDMVGRNHSLYD